MASKKKKRPTPPPPPPSRKPPRAEARPAGPTRRELEREAAAKAARSQDVRRKLLAGGLVLAAVAAVGGYVLQEQRAEAELRDALTSGSCEVDTDADSISGGDGHVANPAYEVNPPSGGDHLVSVSRSGVYRGTSVPPDGSLVHAQEHGYVVAWYSPDLPKDQVAQLEEFEQRHDGDVIVVERADMPTAVAATAWGQRLLCGEVEPAALDRFFEEHVGNGPEDVERG